MNCKNGKCRPWMSKPKDENTVTLSKEKTGVVFKFPSANLVVEYDKQGVAELIGLLTILKEQML